MTRATPEEELEEDRFLEMFRHVHREAGERRLDFAEIPFFMKELPGSPEEVKGNVALQALQALSEEGTPLERALEAKDFGNEAYADAARFHKLLREPQAPNSRTERDIRESWRGELRNAVDAYSRGLGLLNPSIDPQHTHAFISLSLNRCAANLSLGNYGEVKRDSLAVLAVDPQNCCAAIRYAKACKALEQFSRAKHVLEPFLSAEVEEVARLYAEVSGKPRRQDPIKSALEARGMVFRGDCERAILASLPGLSGPPRVSLHNGTPSFPLLLFMPPYGTADLVHEWPETVPFGEQLAGILSEEGSSSWDPQRLYSPANPAPPVLYLRTCRGEEEGVGSLLEQVSMQDSPASVIARGLIRYFDLGVLALYLLPRTHCESFLALLENNNK